MYVIFFNVFQRNANMPSDHDEKVSPKLSKSKKKRLKKREKAEKSDKTQTEAEKEAGKI